MALITRFTRLFHADMHAVLDRLEEPDLLLRQAIREMEDDVATQARRVKARELEQRGARARLDEIGRAEGRIAAELALCVDANNESLARTLLRRRLENERLARQIEQHLARLQQLAADDGAALEERRRRLESMRQRAAVLDVEPKSPESPRWERSDLTVTDADVDIAWLREQQKRRAP
jgi:phage shock protein A